MANFCSSFRVTGEEIERYLRLGGKKLSNFGRLYSKLQNSLNDYWFYLPRDKTTTIVSSGHTALMTALHLVDAKTVVIPNYTFSSTLQAAKLQNMNTVIVDVDSVTASLTVDILRETPDVFDTVLFVCPLSYIPDELYYVSKWCKKHNKKLVIDGAATFGSVGKHFELGDAYCMSFHATKNLPVGECGTVIHSKELEDKAKQYITFGMNSDKQIETAGLNAKVSEYTCAVALALLHKIKPRLNASVRNSNVYYACFDWDIEMLPQSSIYLPVFSSFPIYIRNKEKVKQILTVLQDNNIDALQYYVPLVNNPIDYSVSHTLYESSVLLPCHADIEESQIRFITDLINGALYA